VTTVEQVVTPEEDVTTVDETRPEGDAPTEVPEPEVPEAAPEPEPVTVELFTFHPAEARNTFPPSIVEAFGDVNKANEWLKQPIEIVPAKTVVPVGCERWFFTKIRSLTGLDQPLFWLTEAKVNPDLQERIMLLTDGDFMRFFDEWQKASFGADQGE
jgi:hypothetical protein